MAVIETNTAAPRAESAFGAWVHNLRVRWAQNREYRRVARELRALSDHDLDDMGVSRAEIDMRVRQG